LIFRGADVKVNALNENYKLNQDERSSMIDGDNSKELWMKLCEKAAVEQDPEKLVALAQEICRLLDEREKRLKGVSS
jgi:hypothetical protein